MKYNYNKLVTIVLFTIYDFYFLRVSIKITNDHINFPLYRPKSLLVTSLIY